MTEEAIYFDLKELLPFRKQEVFVDACNIALIRTNLGNSRDFEIIEKALWSETTELSIDAKGNCATSVTENNDGNGQQKIGAVALDNILSDREVTFIKMDIEGAEVAALHGAARIISEQKPRLAISIYHRPEDIWEIPGTILCYNPDYKFYLRHYSFSDYDTVLYAIP